MRYIIFFILLLSVIGCNQGGTSQHNDQATNLMSSDEERSRLENSTQPMRKYTQSDEQGIGEHGTEREIFKTEEALKVTQKLSERDDVRHAQVATSEKQVVAFVVLKDFQNHDVAKSLEEDVREIVPQKDIFIYTDKVHYNRVEDLKSSMKARQIGDDLQKFFEQQLNLKIKD